MTRPTNIRWNTRLDQLMEIIKPHIVRPAGKSGPSKPGPTHAVTYALDQWAQQINAGQALDKDRFNTYLASYAQMIFKGASTKERVVKNVYFTDEMEAQIKAINEVVAPLAPNLAGNKTAIVILAMEKAADELRETA